MTFLFIYVYSNYKLVLQQATEKIAITNVEQAISVTNTPLAFTSLRYSNEQFVFIIASCWNYHYRHAYTAMLLLIQQKQYMAKQSNRIRF